MGKASRRRKQKITQEKLLNEENKVARLLDKENSKVEEAYKEMMANSVLGEALGVSQFEDIGGVQLSQADTLFKNNRWYLVSNMRQLLSQVYVEIGLIQTIVDVPVDDGFSGGLEIQTKQLSEEQIKDLETKMQQCDDMNTGAQGMKWNRLFGGGAIIIISSQDPKSPLDIEALEDDKYLEFRAIDMWELYYSKQNTEDYSAAIDGSELETEYYDYYGQQVHRSRVILLKGKEAPSLIRPKLRGWGVSVVETLVRSINQYLKATDLTFEVLDEFKLDIFKIKGLTTALYTKEGQEAVRRRTALANLQKNYQNAMTMDSEDDYVQKQLSFSGLGEAMEGIRLQVASDLRMPLTKLFGISAAGFNSGEDDIENYNSMVRSTVRDKARPMLLKMIKIRCQQLFGFIPDDLTIEFEPLRIMNSEQEENVKTSQFNRALQARQAGEITRAEFREIVNRGNLLEMQLETTGSELDELDMEDESTIVEATPIKNPQESENRALSKEAKVTNSKGKLRKYLPNFGIKK